MGSLSSKYQDVKYLLCVIDVLNKYAWVRPLTNKKPKTFLYGFIGIVSKSKRKPNKLWFDQGRKFYINLMQKRLDNNNILMF